MATPFGSEAIRLATRPYAQYGLLAGNPVVSYIEL